MGRLGRCLNLGFRLLAPLVFATFPGLLRAETVNVGGVGMAMPLVQRLAEAYRKKEPDTTINLVLPPLGSGGAIRALAAGRIDLVVSGRTLTPEELVQVGKLRAWARTPLGLATSDGTRPAGFSTGDLASVYTGRLAGWDNGSPLRLIMRAERESDTQYLRHLSPEMDQAMTAAFARKGLVVAENDLDAIRLVETVPGSLGPVTTGLAILQGSRVKFLPLNGVAPSARSLADGRYPLAKTLYLVGAAHPGAAAERFATFLQSPAARTIMATADFIPAAE